MNKLSVNHLIGIKQLKESDIDLIFQTADNFKEIIYEKNPFYSVLALNLILEKKLIKDTGKILLYFEKLEGISLNDEQKALVDFKKALFLINGPDVSEGKKILRKIIESKSRFQSLAQDILSEY